MRNTSILPILGQNCNLNWELEREGTPMLLTMPSQSSVWYKFQEMELRGTEGMDGGSNAITSLFLPRCSRFSYECFSICYMPLGQIARNFK